jgi:hypothetical protein
LARRESVEKRPLIGNWLERVVQQGTPQQPNACLMQFLSRHGVGEAAVLEVPPILLAPGDPRLAARRSIRSSDHFRGDGSNLRLVLSYVIDPSLAVL